MGVVQVCDFAELFWGVPDKRRLSFRHNRTMSETERKLYGTYEMEEEYKNVSVLFVARDPVT